MDEALDNMDPNHAQNVVFDEATVRQRASELAETYQKETSRDLSQQLASADAAEASSAHAYLFLKAANDEDSSSRALSVQAHVTTFTDSGAAAGIKSPYGDAVSKRGDKLADVFPNDFAYEGMLANGQEIIKGVSLGEEGRQTLHINNEALLPQYQAFVEKYREMREALTDRPLDAGLTQERVSAVLAAQMVGAEFFGLINEHSSALNAKTYTASRQAELQQFRKNSSGSASAVCTEWSALTHQLLGFAGERSQFVSGAMVSAGEEQDNINHAFGLVGESDQMFVYDSSNPLFVKDEHDPTQMAMRVYLAPVDPGQVERFNQGRAAHVQYGGEERYYSNNSAF